MVGPGHAVVHGPRGGDPSPMIAVRRKPRRLYGAQRDHERTVTSAGQSTFGGLPLGRQPDPFVPRSPAVTASSDQRPGPPARLVWTTLSHEHPGKRVAF